ncbi:hypothetical protein F5Y10DRAFT_270207 [Nemania abortiva]|nr:hypothetical protein F5Y10DRAFT_270207 [Nemania abortiva]
MSHRLHASPQFDAGVTEWRILKAVQPLFAAHIPWDLTAPDVAAMATAITIDTEKQLFVYEMFEMDIKLDLLTESKLGQQSYENCREKMKRLLLWLEKLVLGRVLDEPDAQVMAAPVNEEQHTNEELYQSTSLVQTPASDVQLWREFKSLPPELEQTSATPHTPLEPSVVSMIPINPPYQKLEALGRIIKKRGMRDKLLVESCAVLLDLQLSIDQFKRLKSLAINVNRVIDGLPQQMCGLGPSAPGTRKISRTNWESWKATELSSCLYHLIGKAICNNHHEHKAELQLNGFRLDESCANKPLEQAMLVSSCPIGNGWHQCHYTSILPDICGSTRNFRGKPLHIEFDKEDLLFNRDRAQNSALVRPSHLISLKDLLEGGFFGKDHDGDIFDQNDKAVLVLSLARCLIHLWHGLWMGDPWTAESIQFLHETNQILDRHYPYLACDLTKNSVDGQQPTKPTLDDIQLSVLGFAQILAEIETGRRIQLELSLSTIETLSDRIEDTMELGRNKFGRGDYYTAVQRCLQFRTLLRREHIYKKDDLLTVARDVLYTNIIQPLETNFNQIPHPEHTMKPRPLRLQMFTTPRVPIGRVLQVKGDNISTLIPQKRKMPEDIVPVAYINHLGTQVLGPIIPGLMFFDEECNARPEHITRAEAFFSAFDKFRQRHITPKTNEGRNGRPRIRIAVLDTGINTQDEDIRGLVDEIKDGRKKQKTPKTDRNPIKKIEGFTGDEGDEGDDKFGHGTHVAALVLRTAPEADIYIAKAIDWAIENQVDIISMSFGCETDVTVVADALDRASSVQHEDSSSRIQRKKIILLAAASNNGRNSKRTFPARHEGVIAIHSLDGNGNDEGGMNPSREGYFENFGTLGLGIKTSWDELRFQPTPSLDIPGNVAPVTKYKSGSSYATPIAAGIVANCIEWIDYMKAKGRLGPLQYASLRQPRGIRLMLKKQSAIVGDILSIAPWILWKDDPRDPIIDGEAPRQVDEKFDNHVLELLLAELHPAI